MILRLIESTPMNGVGRAGEMTYYHKFQVAIGDVPRVYSIINRTYRPGTTYISFVNCCTSNTLVRDNYEINMGRLKRALDARVLEEIPSLTGIIITIDCFGQNIEETGILEYRVNAAPHSEPDHSRITSQRDFINTVRDVVQDNRSRNNENPESVEVQKLKIALEEYEKLLSSIKEGPFYIGTVLSEEYRHMYRIKKDSGEEVIINAKPLEEENEEAAESNSESNSDGIVLTFNDSWNQNQNEEELKFPKYAIGDRVMLNDAMIISSLPESLTIKAPEIHFDFIEWSDIGGLKSQVAQLRETIEYPIKYADLYKEYGLKPSRGVLLYGPAGCGKTMIAKAIASTFLKGNTITPDSFIYMKGGEMLDPYVGVAERNIKSIFERARNNFRNTGTRSVIFIDEAEAILPARGSRISSDVETTIVPTFLSEMDGLEESNTFIILATNFPKQLDPAVIRPGRIDLKIEVGRPSKEDAVDIFKIYLSKTKCSADITELAEKAAEVLYSEDSKKGLVSGALIRNIVEEATLLSIKRAIAGENNGINLEDILNAAT